MRFVIQKSSLGTAMQPGSTRYVPVNRLRADLREGLGVQHAQARELARISRLGEEGEDPPRHVVDVYDVTRGLGLTSDDSSRVEKAVSGTNVAFTPKTQTHLLTLAKGALVTLLRSMPHVDGDTRMEIAKRANAFWERNARTGLDRPREGALRVAELGKSLTYSTPRSRRISAEW